MLECEGSEVFPEHTLGDDDGLGSELLKIHPPGIVYEDVTLRESMHVCLRRCDHITRYIRSDEIMESSMVRLDQCRSEATECIPDTDIASSFCPEIDHDLR